MFKGSNTLRLNKATVVKALQEFFDKRVTDSDTHMRVASISFDDEHFLEVHLESDPLVADEG